MATQPHPESKASDDARPKTETPKIEPRHEHTTAKRLYRSRTDRMLGGIAGGMAEYFGMDSTLMRLIFVLLVLLPGIGVIAYLIAWIIIPEAPGTAEGHHQKRVAHDAPPLHDDDRPATTRSTTETGRQWLGLVLVAVGAFFLLEPFIDLGRFVKLWPLLLVFIGLIVIFGRSGRR